MSRIYDFLQESNKLARPADLPAWAPDEQRPVPWTPPGSGAASERGDFALFFEILRRQWRVVALCTFGIAAAALVATFLMKPIYEPVVRLDIDPPGYEQFSIEPQSFSSDTEYLQTQVQNLQSDALAMDVIRKLHLATDSGNTTAQTSQQASTDEVVHLTPGENAALRLFKSRLKVDHDPGSRIISVAVGARDPELAAETTNTLARLYVERMKAARQEAITKSVEWLSGQLKDIRTQMDDSNRLLASFQKENGVADVDPGKSTFGEMLADLNKQRTQTASDRIQLESLLNKVQDGNPDALPQVHDSALIQHLTEQLSEVRANLAQARAIYGPNHPNVKRLENQRNELQGELIQQKQGILEELKTAYSAAQARERLMSHEVTDTTRQLSVVAQYNALKREAQATTDLYNGLYSKVQEAAISSASKSTNIRIMDPARVLDKPTRPRRLLNLILGIGSGFVIGIMAAFFLEGMDRSVRTVDDVRQFNQKLSVSIVPVIEGDGDHAIRNLLKPANGNRILGSYQPMLLSRPQSAEAEAVRSLQTSLILSQLSRPPQVLLIASSLPAEGKTTVAVNLATALAQHSPTCIIDCDRRNSVLSAVFKRSTEAGLGEVLAGTLTAQKGVFETHIPGLSVLASGHGSDTGYDVGVRRSMREMLQTLRQSFKFIILDSPPILPYADGRILSTLVDGVVFVGRSRVTTRDAMKRGLEILAQVHSAPILQVVLNAAESDTPDYHYYHYGYKS